MKNIFWLWLCVVVGCGPAAMPYYISDEYPYQKKVYAGFEQVLQAAEAALQESDWEIIKKFDPAVFERQKALQDDVEQIALYARPKTRSLSVGKNDARLNIIIRSSAVNATELEFRYLNVNSLLVKKVHQHRNDALVEQLFQYIQNRLP